MITILELQKTLNISAKEKNVRLDQLIKAIEYISTNMDHLSDSIRKNVDVVAQYNKDQKPILSGITSLFKDKKDSIKDKLKPINMLRSAFGIKEGSRSLADIIIGGIERKKELSKNKKEFAKDYTTFNKKGIAEKNLLGDKVAEKRANELFDKIKAKQVELASANIQVERGKNSVFGRPLQKDVNQQEKIQDELKELMEHGFKQQAIKTTDSNKILDPKTPSQSLDNLTEDSVENAKRMDQQTDVLKQIELNTKGGDKSAVSKIKPTGGGLLGGLGNFFKDLVPEFLKTFSGFIMGGIATIGEGLLGGLKFLFNPAKLGKLISKVFLPITIIATLFSGIYDAFKEYQKSGDIEKALVAGLGGMLKFLSFGLFDKDTVQGLLDKVEPLVANYIVDPIMNLINGISDMFMKYIGDPIENAFKLVKDTFLDISISIIKFLRGIEIPKVVFGKGEFYETSFGPYHPFANDSNKKTLDSFEKSRSDNKQVKPESLEPAVKPSQAAIIKDKTNDVKQADKQSTNETGVNQTVISAPTTINKSNTNQFSTKVVRNSDSSIVRYNTSRAYMF